ncbi:hypothetical protein LZ554_008625 [Drepanopeziza brunnea f. sp. 'monogermtubi']|nr:hypothetical protein LZ554_008625 [Drepanopeziza brunnea f. sp. 'monogermtubi']
MASSPPYNHPHNQNYPSAISPPYPSNAQLPAPMKRRQSEVPTSGPASKRRQLSTASAAGSAHPLRQTSFPPETHGRAPAFSRSPSMDTMSLVSGAGGKKKKSRKSRGKDVETSSVAGSRAKSVMSNTGKSKRRASRGESVDDEEEEEEGGGEEMSLNVALASKEEKDREAAKRAHLVDKILSPSQAERYAIWRQSKLADATVRRIVNQTLSQSVPPNVILAVKAAAKMFSGELIERARAVQSQWIEATGDNQTGLPSPPAEGSVPPEKEKRRGPLLPDHLREAHRRHLLEADGGLVGQLGLWQLQQHSGTERFGVKVGGKRLLK